MTTVAGNGAWPYSAQYYGSLYFGNGGPAVDAVQNNPTSVAISADGVLYITDQVRGATSRCANSQ